MILMKNISQEQIVYLQTNAAGNSFFTSLLHQLNRFGDLSEKQCVCIQRNISKDIVKKEIISADSRSKIIKINNDNCEAIVNIIEVYERDNEYGHYISYSGIAGDINVSFSCSVKKSQKAGKIICGDYVHITKSKVKDQTGKNLRLGTVIFNKIIQDNWHVNEILPEDLLAL